VLRTADSRGWLSAPKEGIEAADKRIIKVRREEDIGFDSMLISFDVCDLILLL
jgi:hypothetical protein